MDFVLFEKERKLPDENDELPASDLVSADNSEQGSSQPVVGDQLILMFSFHFDVRLPDMFDYGVHCEFDIILFFLVSNV